MNVYILIQNDSTALHIHITGTASVCSESQIPNCMHVIPLNGNCQAEVRDLHILFIVNYCSFVKCTLNGNILIFTVYGKLLEEQRCIILHVIFHILHHFNIFCFICIVSNEITWKMPLSTTYDVLHEELRN